MNSLAKKLKVKRKVWKQFVKKSVVSVLSVLVAFGQTGLLVLATTQSAYAVAAAGPNVLINEVMPNPVSGNEWVELYNAGDAAQDLAGWSVRDEVDNFVGTNSSGISGTLNPGEYLLLDSNAAARLNNGGDSAILKDDSGNVIDTVSYTDSTLGRSIGRQQDGLPTIVEFLPSAVSPDTANRCEVTNGSWCSSDLVEAMAATRAGETVELLADVSVSEQAEMDDGITFDGNGFTVSSPFAKTSNSSNSALGAFGDNSVIRNVTFDGTGGTDLHGINTYKTSNVLIENVTTKNYRSGLVVNGSEVTVNNITTSGNIWHGINVDQGSGVTEPAVLTLNGVSSHDESFHVYLDKYATADVTVNDTEGQYDFVENVAKAGDRLYRLTPSTPTGLTVIDYLGNDLQCNGYTNNRSITIDWNDNPISELISEYQFDIKDKNNHRRPTESQYSARIRDEDGEYQYRVRAVDLFGIVGEPTEWCNVTLDREAPVSTLTNPEDGKILSGTVEVRGSVEDENPWRYYSVVRKDGNIAGPGTVYEGESFSDELIFSWDTTAVEDGDYQVRLEARDKAGNKDVGSTDIIDVEVDNTRPEVEILSPEKDETYAGDIEIRASVEDENLKDYRYAIRYYPEGESTSYLVYNSGKISETDGFVDELLMTWDSTTSSYGDGKYRILIETNDEAGNRKVSWHYFYVDNSYPVITDVTFLREGVEAEVFAPGDEFVVRVTTEDQSDVVRVQYWARKYPWDGSQLSSGNLVEISENVWEGSFLVPATYQNGNSLSESELGNYVNFRPFDEFDNSHIGWRENFTIDASGPETTITGPKDGLNSNQPFEITGVTTDPNGVAKVYLEAKAEGASEYDISVAEITDFEADGSWTYVWTPDTEGLYDLRAYGEDSLGNLEMTDYIDNLVYDLTPPSVPELLSPRNMWIQGKAALTNTWSAVSDNLSPVVTYIYRSERTLESVNPGSVWEKEYTTTSKTTPESTIAEMNGHIFNWMVRAIDAAGNMSPWSEARTVTIDTEAPDVELTQPLDGDVLTGVVEVRGTVEDDNLWRYYSVVRKDGVVIDGLGTVYRDDSFTDELLFTWDTTTVEDGEYVIRLSARDKADNKDEDSTVDVTVVVDNSIEGIVNATPDVSTLKTALETANLLSTFESGSDDFTVFAPVNSAFEDLLVTLDITVNELLNLPELSTILAYHVVSGTVLSGTLSDGQEITTLAGKKLFVLFEDDKVFLEDENGGKVEIVAVDIEASNGVVHLIEGVLLLNSEGPEAADVDGVATNDDETEYEEGAKIIIPDDVTVRVLKDGEEYDYDDENGLDEPGEYEIITIDRFGRETSRIVTIVAAAEEQQTSVPAEPSQADNSLNSGDDDQSVEQNQEDDSNSGDQGLNTNSDSQPLDILDGLGGAGVAGSTGVQTVAAAQEVAQNEVESAEGDDENDDSESDDEEESIDGEAGSDDEDLDEGFDNENEGNAFVANIFGFFGDLFGSWWFWIIVIVGGFLLLFPIFRRDDEEDA